MYLRIGHVAQELIDAQDYQEAQEFYEENPGLTYTRSSDDDIC
jgi:hypothetical protein